MYHQNVTPYYNPTIEKISVEGCNIVVNYAELLDQTCVAFPHKHVDYEIFYCLEGQAQTKIEDETFALTEGQMAFLRPGATHGIVYPTRQPEKHLVFAFVFSIHMHDGADKDTLVGQALQRFDKSPYKVMEDRFNARAVILQMLDEFKEERPAKRSVVRALYTQFVIFALRYLTDDKCKEGQSATSERNIAIEITKYMHANYAKNITASDIAEEFAISERHINRLFEAHFGVPLKRSLNFYRLNYAKNYLLDTGYSIEKIAELVGLPSSRALSQLFYREEGMSAREWRARNSSNDGKANSQ